MRRLRRPAVEQAGLRVRRPALADGAGVAGRRGRRPQPALVPHGQRRRHLDARQVGVPVVRGLGSGLPRAAAGDGRSRTSRASSWTCCCGSDTCTRTASFPRTSGTSGTSTHRCTPGRRCSTTASTAQPGERGAAFLKRVFHKFNFTWWVNRKDRDGSNVFEGGFLGLDNIGVFDRSAPLPTGGYLEQADGTAWMAFFRRSCSRSPWSWRRRTRRTGRSRSSSSSIRLDRRRHRHVGEDETAVGRAGRLLLRVLRIPGGARPASRCGRWSACCRCAPRRSSAPGVARLPNSRTPGG